jgi:two-component system chemotaxis sensor kinase CheA
MAAGQRATELKELKGRLDLWLKERERKGSHGTDREVEAFAGSFEPALGRLAKAAEADHHALGSMVDALLEDMKSALMLPFSELLELFPKLVRDLSRESGKEVELTTRGGEIQLDRRIMEELKAPLIHVVRNCIDHGLEAPAERMRKGKPARGSIAIAASSRDARIEISVSDDGAGIDGERVKAAAVRNGVLSWEEAGKLGGPEEVLLALHSGVSTSPMITDLSGRGLGLAIVNEKVEKLNGSLAVETERSAGTTIRMVVPLTLATFRGVLVGACGQVFVLPSTNVERATLVLREEIRTVENRETLSFDGQATPLARLGSVLGIEGGKRPGSGDGAVQVVVLGSAGKRIAFQVDEVLGEREVLVKSLGRQLVRVPNIAGATILADGKVVPILNVADLMSSAAKLVPAPIGAQEPEKRKSILVVEDSITARTLLRTILESAGYNVKTAVDGLDALAALRTLECDLVVSDVEMPRMDGFDLTARIRADKRLAELPVVLVTALDSREDRERGIDVGANAYIVKSSFERGNLLDAVRRLT